MKALTLWQPWASLIATGRKISETRSWAPPEGLIGATIAIHAARRKPKRDEIAHTRSEDLMLPLGVVVCLAEIKAVHRVSGISIPLDGEPQWVTGPEGCLIHTLDAYGDYSTGRYVWVLDKVRKLIEPIESGGWQRLWELDDSLLEHAPLYDLKRTDIYKRNA